MHRPLPLCLVALAAVGCSSTPSSEFPTRSDLGDVLAQPIPKTIFATPERNAEPWELREVLPAALEVKEHVGSAPWDGILRSFASARSGLVFASEAQHCVAEASARYVAEKEAFPPRELRRFIAARCGAASDVSTSRSLTLPATRDQPDAAVLAPLMQGAAKLLEELGGSGAQEVGLAMVRGEHHAVAVAVTSPRKVALRSMPFVPGLDGKIVVRGELLEPAAKVVAYVNRGPFGFARCAVSPRIRLPAFEVTCEPLLTDPVAAIEVNAFPAGRVLGTSVVDTLVFPAGSPTATFTPRRALDGAASGPITPGGVVAALNARRTEAGLAPVALDGPESATVTRLAPHYFAATSGLEDELVADRIVLGVMAGWDVQGVVRFGTGGSLVTPASTTSADLVAAILDSPSRRASLFGPDVRRVALGLLRDDASNAAAALFGGYEILDTTKHPDDTIRLAQRFASMRAARSMPPPIMVTALWPHAARAARAVEIPGNDTEDALSALMSVAVEVSGVGARGWCLYANTVEDFEIPEEILARPNLRVAIAVGHHKAPDAPWTSLVAFVVVVDVAQPNNTARGVTGIRPL